LEISYCLMLFCSTRTAADAVAAVAVPSRALSTARRIALSLCYDVLQRYAGTTKRAASRQPEVVLLAAHRFDRDVVLLEKINTGRAEGEKCSRYHGLGTTPAVRQRSPAALSRRS